VLLCHIAIQLVYRQQHIQILKYWSVFVYEGFCTNRNLLPVGGDVWSIWNIIGNVVYVVSCFQQWQGLLMMSNDAGAQPCPLHMTLCVVRIPLSQRVDAFMLLTSPDR